VNEIDAYLAGLDDPARSTLEEVRRRILAVIPGAEEGLSYGVPAFRVGGKPVAGFAAATQHLSYFPHSGSVVAMLAGDLAGYGTSKGTVRFPLDEPLPACLVERLVGARLEELGIRRP
jgi:uncharacterized protein YdhG (YjbR/CyaY superfamily)